MAIPKEMSEDVKQIKSPMERLWVRGTIYVVIFLVGYMVRKENKFDNKENIFNESNNERFQVLRKQYLYKDSLLNICQQESIAREKEINRDLRNSNHRQDSLLAVLNKVQR